MWSKMKTRFGIISLLLLCLTFLAPNRADASHLMGVDITYECIGQCTVRVYLAAYRDCSGSSFISATPFQFVPQTIGCGQPTPLGAWPTETVQEVTPVCNSVSTQCGGGSGTINGVEEYAWFRDYDVCNNPNCIYQLTWSTCCRNPDITTISNPGSQSIWVGSTTLNTATQPCNNSPYFTNPPVPYICQGQPYTFNQGAVDPEGDSLAFALGPCFTASGTQVPYLPGYTPQQPLGPSWNVTIDAVTGDISVLPTPGNIEVAVLCVYVEEWRNGALINTLVRDVQMNVIPCPNNTVPIVSGITNVTGGSPNGNYEVTVCAGTPLTFDMPVTDPDAGQNQTISWNPQFVPPGATFTSGTQADTITGAQPTGTFAWTPQNTGVYQVLFTVTDDACPIFATNQYTITINVNGGLPNAGITATPTGCTNVSLNANPGTGNTGPYTYQWFGDGNLNVNPNITSQNLNHTFPGPGAYEVNVLITDNFGCQSVLTDTVIIQTGPTADAGPDISVCSGFPVQLGAAQIGGQTYNWFPTTGLNSSTLADPIFVFTNPGPTPDTIDFTLSATAGFCTSFDYVTVIVYPTPTITTNGTQQICVGDNATLTASGGSSYVWSTGETTASITVSPTVTTTYTVTGVENGCASQPVPVTVEVTPGPSAVVTGPISVCPGDDATLTVAGGNSWQWSTGATTQTINLNNLQNQTNVTVTPFDNGCPGPPVSYTVDINEKPIADYTNTTVCVGNATQFDDASTISNGNMVVWRWNFGDPLSGAANISASENPNHTFTDAGTFNVTLMVTSSNGCMDTIVQAVTVNPLPEPDFDFTKACAGFEVDFTDLSTSAAGITDWNWNFGDGSFATVQNPSHNYPNPGPYTVTLTVTDANGCNDQVRKTVIIHPNPVANFRWVHSCFNTITDFTSLSSLTDPLGTTLDLHEWNFGDPNSGASNTSTDINPTHNFTGPGTYNVTLTVTTSQGCQNTIVIPVEVPFVPPLITEDDEVCEGFPGTAEVVGGIQPNTTVAWFYDQASIHPFHYGPTYTSPPLTQTVVYYVAMVDQAGCFSPKVPVFINVNQNPWVDWVFSETEVEIPNAIVEFNITEEHDGPIVSYLWDFGDGSTSEASDPVHQYTETGFYDISLTMIDDFGCVNTQSIPRAIEVIKQVAIFIPNAFTPNNDGLNDEFFVAPKLIRDFEIDIFDRWGKLVYQSMDMNFRWNGNDSSNQPMPEGVYTYRIRAVEFDGERITKSGTVTLYR